jgi:hypothetical protein
MSQDSNENPQMVRIHGPYEDAIIAGCEVIKAVIDGQDPATKKELWTRYLEFTQPLHALATQAMSDVAKFFKGLS